MVFPADFVGCRYKVVQHRRHGEIPRTHVGEERHQRRLHLVESIIARLPDPIIAGTWEETLECMAAGHPLIVEPILTVDAYDLTLQPEALVRVGTAYAPLVISTHQVLYPAPTARTRVIDTHRISLSTPVWGRYSPRHHTLDAYRLSLSALALAQVGMDAGVGYCVGQEETMAAVLDTQPLHEATIAALTRPLPQQPRRVKECAAGCRYWHLCQPWLEAHDDISLVLPGGRADHFRERGITTVQGLIEADAGTPSRLARAWRDGAVALKKVPATQAPRFEVELDIDLEAYQGRGVYLWGTYDGHSYTPFVTWEELGGEAEARNFAAFWEYLQDMHAGAVFCYANGGENHWLRRSAQRFAGKKGVPSVESVERFIGSSQWIDVFKLVKAQLVGPFGLGLKTVAPLAGFTYEEADVTGETSLELYDAGERERLLRYNRDDCRATAAVRHWLATGAPNLRVL
ncbi:MAG: TM0106 family RecB-like putative nuclease [Corynebacterium sp.]|nr:TM0106 family RecB-like putative nuclease [Corynebacterium sp.]